MYRLVLPLGLSYVHAVFHVSMLWKYTPDPTHVVDWGELSVDANGTYEEDLCVLWIARIRFFNERV